MTFPWHPLDRSQLAVHLLLQQEPGSREPYLFRRRSTGVIKHCFAIMHHLGLLRRFELSILVEGDVSNDPLAIGCGAVT